MGVVKGRPLADKGRCRRARPTPAEELRTKDGTNVAACTWETVYRVAGPEHSEEQIVEQSAARASRWQGARHPGTPAARQVTRAESAP